MFKESIRSPWEVTCCWRVSRVLFVFLRSWLSEIMSLVVVASYATVSSSSAILTVWSRRVLVRFELDSLSLFISSCCLLCQSRRVARLVEWLAMLMEWLFIISAFWEVFNCAA